MKNIFSVFRDTEVEIFEAVGVSSYSSDTQMTLKKVIRANVVPYSSWQKDYGLTDKAFSLENDRWMKMYFDNSDIGFIQAGNYARAGGVMYRIENSHKRSMGAMAVLKEATL